MERLNKLFSKSVSGFLDRVAFSKDRIRQRIAKMDRCSEAKTRSTKSILKRQNRRSEDIQKIFVGSKREGMGLEFYNDTDCLQVNNGVFCTRDVRNTNAENRTLVLQMVTEDVPAGYCFIKQSNTCPTEPEKVAYIEEFLVKRKGDRYLSSEIYASRNADIIQEGNGSVCKRTQYMPREGPSNPKSTIPTKLEKETMSNLNLEMKHIDVVRAFPCDVRCILERWKNERFITRYWPNEDVISTVCSLPGYVVPVGQKGSANEDIQWRICLTLAEIHLVQSFNNTQSKVFVLLKLIAKHTLQPLCKDLSSYVIKNIMLWFAEKTPQKYFEEEYLMVRLEEALFYLAECVEKKYLPCYMIPDRNLFDGKLQDTKESNDVLNIIKDGIDVTVVCMLLEPDILKAFATLYNADLIDRTCKLSHLTVEELSVYYEHTYLCSAEHCIMLDNIPVDETSLDQVESYEALEERLFVLLSKEVAKKDQQRMKLNLKIKQKRNMEFCTLIMYAIVSFIFGDKWTLLGVLCLIAVNIIEIRQCVSVKKYSSFVELTVHLVRFSQIYHVFNHFIYTLGFDSSLVAFYFIMLYPFYESVHAVSGKYYHGLIDCILHFLLRWFCTV